MSACKTGQGHIIQKRLKKCILNNVTSNYLQNKTRTHNTKKSKKIVV